MTKKIAIIYALILVILFAFCIGHWLGYNSGQRETQIAMAHFLSEKD